MSYVIYNNKRVSFGTKYVTGVVAEPLVPIFSNWTNSTWDTFVSSGLNISSAIDTANGIALTDYETFVVGDIIEIQYNLILNSGSLPTLRFWSQTNGDLGTANMVQGIGVWQFTAQAFGGPTWAIGFRASASGTNASCTFSIYKK